MDDYLKIEFRDLSNQQKEIIIALLAQISYQGFEEEDDGLKAFISSSEYDEQILRETIHHLHPVFSVEKIEGRNWNREWELNFHPVVIGRSDKIAFAGIRADFHQPMKNVRHEIIITPKMSFGTGHHVTTAMMIEMMSELEFAGKTVLDFGTGTGILAILAEKLGATKVIAIDNDDQCIENAAENFKSNLCNRIELLKSSSADSNQKFDFILANITKNVIVCNLPAFTQQLLRNGTILLSGLLEDDEFAIFGHPELKDLYLAGRLQQQSWICMKMRFQHPALQ